MASNSSSGSPVIPPQSAQNQRGAPSQLANSGQAGSPGPGAPVTSDRVSAIVGTVTGVISAIEQIVAASGLGAALNIAQIEQLTTLFGNLAGVAIRAAHDVLGQEITPDSVLALMPVATALAEPEK